MARVPYVPDDGPDERATDALARVELRRGNLSPLIRALANSPTALVAFDEFSNHVSTSCVDPLLRELVVLRIARTLDNDYEWRRHLPRAISAGASPSQLAALSTETLAGLFDDRQQTALRLVDEFLRSWKTPEEVGRALADRFSPEEVIELLLTLGWYLLVAALIIPLDLIADDHEASGP